MIPMVRRFLPQGADFCKIKRNDKTVVLNRILMLCLKDLPIYLFLAAFELYVHPKQRGSH